MFRSLAKTSHHLKCMKLTWQHTRKMKRVMAVHSTFSLNWIWIKIIGIVSREPEGSIFIVHITIVKLGV